jgi:hypothetical protein
VAIKNPIQGATVDTAQEVTGFVNVNSIGRDLDVYQQVATWFSLTQNAFRNAAGKNLG